MKLARYKSIEICFFLWSTPLQPAILQAFKSLSISIANCDNLTLYKKQYSCSSILHFCNINFTYPFAFVWHTHGGSGGGWRGSFCHFTSLTPGTERTGPGQSQKPRSGSPTRLTVSKLLGPSPFASHIYIMGAPKSHITLLWYRMWASHTLS